MKKVVTVSWSGGKDSAFALYKILLSGEYVVKHLHTVINQETGRVGLHGVREELIEQQAKSLGLPLIKLYLTSSDDHTGYEELMKSFYAECAREKIEGVIFGDIFLEDLKAYRERLLQEHKLQGIYPIWKTDTKLLLQDFLNVGFKTVICSANGKFFQHDEVGKIIDQDFIKSLPDEVDACGENGEFHTFVFDGPIFSKPITFEKGKVVEKTYSYNMKTEGGQTEQLRSSFWFQDLEAIDR